MSREIRVARPGKNALTATSPNDFIFHSAYNTFKIITEALVLGQTIDSDPKIITVAHNQSSIPAVYGIAKFSDGYACPPGEKEHADNTPPIERYWRIEVDATNIYFIFYKGTTPSYTVSFRYYIFESPL